MEGGGDKGGRGGREGGRQVAAFRAIRKVRMTEHSKPFRQLMLNLTPTKIILQNVPAVISSPSYSCLINKA